jgi:hypothetical protein
MFKLAIRHLITLTVVVFLLGGCAALVGTSILTAGIVGIASNERDDKEKATDNKVQQVSQLLSKIKSNHISGNSNASDLSEITSNHISGNGNASDFSEITINHISGNGNALDLFEITSNHISGNGNPSDLSEITSNHISGNGNASDLFEISNSHISGNSFQNKSERSSSQSYSHRNKKGYGYKIVSDISVYTRKCPFTQLLKVKIKLGLTELQIKEIKSLQFEFQKQSILNEAEHEIAHMELDRLVHAESVDAEAIHSVTGKIVALKAKMIMKTAEAKIILLGLLTDEQRKKA